MLGVRARVCHAIARRLIRPPEENTGDMSAYTDWRDDALAESWQHFQQVDVTGKDVVDFGSGKGSLTFYLASRGAKSVTGVELHGPSIEECRARQATLDLPEDVPVRFEPGSPHGIPLDDDCCDILCAFDVVEHVMNPAPIVAEWRRVLRPGGRLLIDWCPWRSPWAPHMESLVPIPWAHVIFGEQALFRTAEWIYDSPDYTHRPWDFDDDGVLLPNKWKQWSSFSEQGYINQLNVAPFKDLMGDHGFDVSRFEHHTFGSLPGKDTLGPMLMKIPVVNEYLASYVIGEFTLVR